MSVIYALAKKFYLQNCRTFFQIKGFWGFLRLSLAVSAGKNVFADLGFLDQNATFYYYRIIYLVKTRIFFSLISYFIK